MTENSGHEHYTDEEWRAIIRRWVGKLKEGYGLSERTDVAQLIREMEERSK